MDKETVIKVNNQAEVAAAIPLLLSYQPRESLVVVCCHGPNGRFGIIQRYDLDLALEAPVEFLTACTGRVARESPDMVIVLIYTEQPDTACDDDPLPHLELRQMLTAAFGDLIRDFQIVRDGKTTCGFSPQCCEGWTPVLAHAELEAARAYGGSTVAGDRSDLITEFAYDSSDFDPERTVDDPAELLNSLTNRRSEGLSIEGWEYNALANGARHDNVFVRDRILIKLLDKAQRSTIVAVLIEAARRTPDEHAAPITSLAAWGCYLMGDGTRANVGITRVLAIDPTYSLALLIDDALCRQVPPSLMEDVLVNAAEDLSRLP